DRKVKVVFGDAGQGRWEGLFQPGEEVAPERPATADLVLPEPGLGFVHAEGAVTAARLAEPVCRQILLVQAVAGLVQDAEERLGKEARVEPCGEAAVAGADAGAERVGGGVEPA